MNGRNKLRKLKNKIEKNIAKFKGCNVELPDLFCNTNFFAQHFESNGCSNPNKKIGSNLGTKRYSFTKYLLLHDGNGCENVTCSILWLVLRIVISQSSSGMRTQPTIDLNTRSCTTSCLCKNLCVSASEAKPNIAVGETIAWNDFDNINLFSWKIAPSTPKHIAFDTCVPPQF